MHGVVLRARAAWPPTIGPYRDLLVAAVNVCRAEVDTAGGAGILNSIPKTEMFHGNFPEMGQKATGPTRSGPVGKMFIIGCSGPRADAGILEQLSAPQPAWVSLL